MRNVTEENLKDYAISVHSFKSGCAAIGAVKMSGRAKKLEAMSKAGDLKAVLAENDGFIKDADTLIEKIKTALEGRS